MLKKSLFKIKIHLLDSFNFNHIKLKTEKALMTIDCFKKIIESTGEDISRPGLIDTPKGPRIRLVFSLEATIRALKRLSIMLYFPPSLEKWL